MPHVERWLTAEVIGAFDKSMDDKYTRALAMFMFSHPDHVDSHDKVPHTAKIIAPMQAREWNEATNNCHMRTNIGLSLPNGFDQLFRLPAGSLQTDEILRSFGLGEDSGTNLWRVIQEVFVDGAPSRKFTSSNQGECYECYIDRAADYFREASIDGLNSVRLDSVESVAVAREYLQRRRPHAVHDISEACWAAHPNSVGRTLKNGHSYFAGYEMVVRLL